MLTKHNARATCSQPRRTLIFASLLVGLLGTGTAAAANHASDPQCLALAERTFLDVAGGDAATRIMTAELVPAQAASKEQIPMVYYGSRVMSAPERAPAQGFPAHCRVRGYVTPNVKFEMRMPVAAKWNGKFLFGACNGFCGDIDDYVSWVGILRGYATMTSDGGHYGESGFDSVWARNNTQARIDFAYRANHVTRQAADRVISTYYDREPSHAYITGCSKGGHAGVMAAQRFPGDFDGVISRGPTIDYTGVNLLHLGQRSRAVYAEDGSVILGAHRHALIKEAVMAQCDLADGLKDGLISNPAGCRFDPGALQCAAGQSGAQCLEKPEVDALRTIYAPVRDKRGNEIYPATDPGSEGGWLVWGLPKDSSHEVWGLLAFKGYLQGVAFEQAPAPGYDWRGFDWDRDRDRLAAVSAIMDATNPDLRGFRDAGGKMIVVHGWSDEAVTASASVKWYDEVAAYMGGHEKVAEFSRLFLLPGVDHCGSNGVGPSTYDALAALERWVEQGIAPDQLLTTQETLTGAATRTRPVYPYPLQTRYSGSGDVNNAKNFVPHSPQ